MLRLCRWLWWELKLLTGDAGGGVGERWRWEAAMRWVDKKRVTIEPDVTFICSVVSANYFSVIPHASKAFTTMLNRV